MIIVMDSQQILNTPCFLSSSFLHSVTTTTTSSSSSSFKPSLPFNKTPTFFTSAPPSSTVIILSQKTTNTTHSTNAPAVILSNVLAQKPSKPGRTLPKLIRPPTAPLPPPLKDMGPFVHIDTATTTTLFVQAMKVAKEGLARYGGVQRARAIYAKVEQVFHRTSPSLMKKLKIDKVVNTLEKEAEIEDSAWEVSNPHLVKDQLSSSSSCTLGTDHLYTNAHYNEVTWSNLASLIGPEIQREGLDHDQHVTRIDAQKLDEFLNTLDRLSALEQLVPQSPSSPELTPESALAELYRSWAHLESIHQVQNPSLARKLYISAIQAGAPPHVEASIWCAWALMEQKQLNIVTARKCFVQGLNACLDHGPLIQAFAVFEAKYGSAKKARKLFAKAVEVDRNSQRHWVAWADFESIHNSSRARFLYDCAYRISSRSTDQTPLSKTEKDHADDLFHTTLAWARFEEKMRNFKKTRQLLSDILDREASSPRALHVMANFEVRMKAYDRARDLFAKTVQAEKEEIRLSLIRGNANLKTHASLAMTYQAWAILEKKCRNFDQARHLLKTGLAYDPTHPHLWHAWARLEIQLRNFDTARYILQKAVELIPTSQAPLYHTWAQMESKAGNLEKARSLFAKAIKVDPSHVHSAQAWACLEAAQQNHDIARSLFTRATKADPSNAHAWQAWARMEEALHNTDKARALYTKASDMNPLHTPSWNAWRNMESRIAQYNRQNLHSQQQPNIHLEHALSCPLPEADV